MEYRQRLKASTRCEKNELSLPGRDERLSDACIDIVSMDTNRTMCMQERNESKTSLKCFHKVNFSLRLIVELDCVMSIARRAFHTRLRFMDEVDTEINPLI